MLWKKMFSICLVVGMIMSGLLVAIPVVSVQDVEKSGAKGALEIYGELCDDLAGTKLGTIGNYSSARAYRIGLNSVAPVGYMSDITDGTPAFASWDVGTTQWNLPNPPNAGQEPVMIFEVVGGVNGYPAGSVNYTAYARRYDANDASTRGTSYLITALDIVANCVYMDTAFLEPIPMPDVVQEGSAVNVSWVGLKGQCANVGSYTGADVYLNNGTQNYTVYRSEDNVSFPYLGVSTDQVSEGAVWYVDSTVVLGTTYYYKIAVNFRADGVTADNLYTTTGRSYGSAGITPTAPDTTPPATTSDLSVTSISTTSVTLGWTAPGDDGVSGIASSYEIRMNTAAITSANWATSTLIGTPTPGVNETAETFTNSSLSLSVGDTRWFALKTWDEVSNPSGVSNSPSETVTAEPTEIGISTTDEPTYTPVIAPYSMDADGEWTLYCYGYNASAGGWFGTVSADWTVYSVTTGSGTFSVLTGKSTVFNATTVGDCTVNVTRTGVTENWTATITITPGALAKVVITDIPDGTWYPGTTIPSGNPISLNASGYDSDNNYIGLAECTWTVTGGIGTVSPGTGTATTFTATTAGGGTVNADNATVAGSPDNSTGTITVTVPYQPDYLIKDPDTGTLDGDGDYDQSGITGTDQQNKTKVLGAAGDYWKWEIKLENDGTTASDTITVDVFEEAKPAGWYWTLYNGTTNITSSLPCDIGLAGSGGFTTLYLNVTSPATAGFGEAAIIKVNATSAGASDHRDCVRATTKIQAAADAGWIETWIYPSPASTELTYTISVKVYNNQPGSNTWNVKLTIDGSDAPDSPKPITIPGTSAGWANFTGITFTEGSHDLKVWVDDLGPGSAKGPVSITAVTIPPAPTTSFEPTVIGIGIAMLVVAILGTMVVWRKKKEKKKTKE